MIFLDTSVAGMKLLTVDDTIYREAGRLVTPGTWVRTADAIHLVCALPRPGGRVVALLRAGRHLITGPARLVEDRSPPSRRWIHASTDRPVRGSALGAHLRHPPRRRFDTPGAGL